LVIDQDTREVLFSKNEEAVLPIASLTKLMTGLIISEAKLPMDEVLTITQADVDTEKGSTSRLKVGTQLTRREMLHLALMSSENRAASALGRTYPGGLQTFVGLMNAMWSPQACPAKTNPAPKTWPCWSTKPQMMRSCVSFPPHRVTRWPWVVKPCSTTTPTVW
jgi:D-alanyl-D-alanine carboxypeptidase